MKKLITIFFSVVLFCSIGNAEIRFIEDKTLSGKTRIYVAKVCVDGYLFLVTKSHNADSRSMVQFFENINGTSVPKKC